MPRSSVSLDMAADGNTLSAGYPSFIFHAFKEKPENNILEKVNIF